MYSWIALLGRDPFRLNSESGSILVNSERSTRLDDQIKGDWPGAALEMWEPDLAFLDWIRTEPDDSLEGSSVRLCRPRLQDFDEWVEIRTVSRQFLQPWEPTWHSDELTRAAYRRRIALYQRDWEADCSYAYLIRRKDDGRLVGGITLSNVRRGVSQAATVGYWSGVGHVRQGNTLEAVNVLAGHAFGVLGLHRIEAACLPHNHPSRRLLARAEFLEEGLARSYLKINGTWADHLLFARLAPG